jgi:ABC-type Fe3+ transport system substrate-binding protein
MRKNDPHIFGGRRRAGIINKRQSSKWSIAEFVLAMTLAAFFHLQSLNGASVEDVALLKSADRQKILVEGAKKEGKLSFYTTLIVEQVVRPLKDAFEKEYPFIQVEFFRGNSDRITQRLFAEYQAKRYAVDVVDGSSTTTMVQRAGYLQKFFSPHLAEYPAELKDPQGYWGVSNVYFHTLGYNTRMVKPNEVPRTYEELLNPRWKGQMIWSTGRGGGGPLFVGNLFQTMGETAGKVYLQKLKAQNIAKSTASARQVLDLVIAGEYPLVLVIFNHHAYISKTAGAPSEWLPLEPVAATISTIGLPKFAPHPHAALLFLDFVISKRGQKIFQLSNYLPSHPEMPAIQADLKPGGGRFKRVNYMNPEVQFDKGNEWVEYFQKNFVQ